MLLTCAANVARLMWSCVVGTVSSVENETGGDGNGIQIGVEMEINLQTTGSGNFMMTVALPSHDFLRPLQLFGLGPRPCVQSL